VDPDTGVNLGALVNFYDNGSKESPFFRYAPYRQQIALVGLVTTKKMYQFVGFLDQPYFLDTPWRLRVEAEFLNNPVQYYFGIGQAGQQLVVPGTGQVFGSYGGYKSALEQQSGGDTNAKYDLYGLSRLGFQAAAEYDLLGGLIRPLFGIRIARVWIDDYTGDTVDGARQLATHMRDDCSSGRARGCGGGFDNFVKLGFTFDTRDFEPDPSTGILAQLTAELSPKFLGSAFNYGRLTASLAGFGTVLRHRMQQVVLAGRFLYVWQFGDVPFYSMNTLAFNERDRQGLGGLRSIRGYKQDRFIGPVMMAGNMELRWSFVEFRVFKQDLKLMAVPFLDAGRAFDGMGSVTMSDWHLAGGAGIRMAWNLSTIICFDYGFASEGQAFYMDLSHQF
jgi:outer membrane protein assembly factor BamA